MKRRLLTIATLLLLAATLRAETELDRQMEIMKRAYRELKIAMEAPKDADKAKYLAAVDKLRAASEESKKFEPAMTKDVAAEKRADFLTGYKQEMDELIEQIDELKQQITDGKWDDAKKQLGLINQAQRDGHKQYRAEKKEGRGGRPPRGPEGAPQPPPPGAPEAPAGGPAGGAPPPPPPQE